MCRKPTWNLIGWYPHDYSHTTHNSSRKIWRITSNPSYSWFSPGTPFWGNAKKSVEPQHNHAQSGQGCTSYHPPTWWNWIGSCEGRILGESCKVNTWLSTVQYLTIFRVSRVGSLDNENKKKDCTQMWSKVKQHEILCVQATGVQGMPYGGEFDAFVLSKLRSHWTTGWKPGISVFIESNCIK